MPEGIAKVGETNFWDSFVSPDTNKPRGQVFLGLSIDNYMTDMATKASKMSFIEAAFKSRGGGEFDIKAEFPGPVEKSYYGFLFQDKYVTLREAGDIFYGINAASNEVSFDYAQKGAGAYQKSDLIGAGLFYLFGKTYGNAPNWGENDYQRTKS